MENRKKRLYFILLMSILVLFIGNLTLNKSHILLENQPVNLVPIDPILAGDEIIQDIKLPDHKSSDTLNLKILMATYGRQNKGVLEIELLQGNKKQHLSYALSIVKDNDYFNIPIGSGYKNGILTVKLSTKDTVNNESITCWLSESIVEKTKLIRNGQSMDRSLTYRVESVEKNFDWIWLSIIYLIFGVLLVYFSNRIKNVYLILGFAFSVVALYCRFPLYFTHPEIYAEQGTNFIFNNLQFPFIKTLVMDEFSYWPLYQRLSAYIFEWLGIIGPINYYMGYFTIAMTVIFISSINLSIFDEVMDKETRVLITFMLAMAPFTSFEEFTFINHIYFAIIPLVFLIFVNKEKISNRKLFVLATISIILILSKALFLILLPVYFVLFIKAWMKKNKKEALYSILMSGALIVQLVYMFFHKNQFVVKDAFLERKIITLFGIPKSFLETFIRMFESFGGYISIAIGLLTLLLICLIIYRYYKYNKKGFKVVGILLYIAIANILFSWISYGYGSNIFNRHHLISNIFLRIIVIMSIYELVILISKRMNLKLEQGFMSYATVTAMSLFVIIQVIGFNNSGPSTLEEFGASDWNSYYSVINNDEYLIPINPYPWVMSKNVYEVESSQYKISDEGIKLPNIQFNYLLVKLNHNLEVNKSLSANITLSNGEIKILDSIPTNNRKYKLFKLSGFYDITNVEFKLGKDSIEVSDYKIYKITK